MTIGTGVFLGLISIAAVWLYVATRNHWKWRRNTLAVLAAILVISVSLFGWNEFNSYVDNRPTRQTEFLGLQIGMPKGDVIFIKGKAKSGKDDDDVWVYANEYKTEIVGFRNGRIRYIAGMSKNELPHNIPTLQGISGYSTTEDVEKKFGKPDFISIRDDQTKRLWSFNSFGLFFSFQKGVIDAVGIFDPAEGPLRFIKEFDQ
jgi:hypothetical protein